MRNVLHWCMPCCMPVRDRCDRSAAFTHLPAACWPAHPLIGWPSMLPNSVNDTDTSSEHVTPSTRLPNTIYACTRLRQVVCMYAGRQKRHVAADRPLWQIAEPLSLHMASVNQQEAVHCMLSLAAISASPFQYTQIQQLGLQAAAAAARPPLPFTPVINSLLLPHSRKEHTCSCQSGRSTIPGCCTPKCARQLLPHPCCCCCCCCCGLNSSNTISCEATQ
jgi:hypothetical protein